MLPAIVLNEEKPGMNVEYPIFPARDPSGRTSNVEATEHFEIQDWIFDNQYSHNLSISME